MVFVVNSFLRRRRSGAPCCAPAPWSIAFRRDAGASLAAHGARDGVSSAAKHEIAVVPHQHDRGCVMLATQLGGEEVDVKSQSRRRRRSRLTQKGKEVEEGLVVVDFVRAHTKRTRKKRNAVVDVWE